MKSLKKILAVVISVLMVVSVMPITALAADGVAEVNDTSYATLKAAAAAATAEGDVITLTADIADAGNVSLAAGVTLYGDNHKISGNSNINIDVAGGKITNVNFSENHNSTSKLSPVYAKKLAGTATITNCTFTNWDWDAIQSTPVAGANIVITGCTFTAGEGANVHRAVHVQSGYNVNFSATVTGNKFYGAQYLSETFLEVYWFTDSTKMNLSGNYLDSPSSVCIQRGYGWDATELALPLANEDLDETVDTQTSVRDSKGNIRLYPTVKEAVEAAEAGQTVTLLEDIDLGEVALEIPEGKNIILNTNGKTLTTAYKSAIWNYGTLTVKGNGTISTTCENDTVVIRNDGTLTVGYVTIGTEAEKNIQYSIQGRGNSSTTVNTGAILYGGLVTNGSNKVAYNNADITVNSGMIYGDTYLANGFDSDYTINGGTFYSDYQLCMEVKGGNLTINGGKFTYVGDITPTKIIPNGNGNSTYGYCLAIVAQYPYGATNATITGGTFTGVVEAMTIPSTKGTAAESTFAISGGTFSKDPSAYLADGYAVAEDEDLYTVTNAVEASLTVDGNIDSNTYIDLDAIAETKGEDVSDLSVSVKHVSVNSVSTEVTDTYKGATLAAQKTAEGTYLFQYDANPAQLTFAATITVEDADGNVVMTKTYSMNDYCDALIATGDSKNVTLGNALKDYATSAQELFEVNTDDLANDGNYQAAVKNVTADDVASVKNTDDNLGTFVKGVSFLALSKSAVAFNLKVDADSLTYELDSASQAKGMGVETIKTDDGRNIVVVSNISAADLDTAFTLTISDGTTSTVITYSALDFAKAALNYSGTDAGTKKLAQALKLYNDAANEYFAS